jgi:hypothetical protein
MQAVGLHVYQEQYFEHVVECFGTRQIIAIAINGEFPWN